MNCSNQADKKGNSSGKKSIILTENDLVLVSEILDSVEDKSEEEQESINKVMNLAFSHVYDNSKVKK